MKITFELEELKKVLHATSGNTKDFVMDESGWILQMIANYKGSLVKSDSISNVSGTDKGLQKDLFKLINRYVDNGLKKPDLVRSMEYVTDSCKKS